MTMTAMTVTTPDTLLAISALPSLLLLSAWTLRHLADRRAARRHVAWLRAEQERAEREWIAEVTEWQADLHAAHFQAALLRISERETGA